MVRVLMSFKPAHADRILGGEKTHELRRVRCSRDPGSIVIYSTAPVGKLVGEVSVTGTLSMAPEELWHMVSEGACMEKGEFDAYFRGAGSAVAYLLGAVEEYPEPLPLSSLGLHRPPRSFMYLPEETTITPAANPGGMDLSESMRPSGEGTEVDVSVSPGSDRPGMDGYDPWRKRIILRVAAPPADGKANKEVQELVSEITGFRSEIIRGQTSRQKTVFVEGSPDDVLRGFSGHVY